MRLHGWCTECRRPRLVTTSGHALALAAARRTAVPTGVCDDCARRIDVKRRITQRYGHTWEAEIRIAAELAGHRVRSVTHDPMIGYTVLLEDGRELEAATARLLSARLSRLPRR